ILSLICNNASNNDILVDNLANKVALFGGHATHVHCFMHVMNLVMKSVLVQSD
ncbi:hypothetical protein BJV74DRAFT_715565, partial [Russula compacta]